jgi:hypothetical protein
MEAGVSSLTHLQTGEPTEDDFSFFPTEDYDEIRAHAMEHGNVEGSDDEGDGAGQVN